MSDFMSLIASFSGKYYRMRSKENQKKLLKEAEKELNTENIIKLFAEVIENPMNFHEFLKTCQETLNINEDNGTITMKTYEKK